MAPEPAAKPLLMRCTAENAGYELEFEDTFRRRHRRQACLGSPCPSRGLAPQPPRLDALGDARPPLGGARPLRPSDPRPAPARPGLERGEYHAAAPAGEGRSELRGRL